LDILERPSVDHLFLEGSIEAPGHPADLRFGNERETRVMPQDLICWRKSSVVYCILRFVRSAGPRPASVTADLKPA